MNTARQAGLLWILSCQLMLSYADGQDKLDDGERIAHVTSLTRLLVSPNAKPKDADWRFEADYDREKQAVVYLTAMRLLQEEMVAVNALMKIEKSDDRYCMSFISPYGTSHLSISDVANRMLEQMVFAGAGHEDDWLIPPFSSLKAWIASQKETSLQKLQLKAIRERLRQLDERTFTKGLRRGPYQPELSQEDFEAKKATVTNYLKQRLEFIEASGVAVTPVSLDKFQSHSWGLPWNSNEPPF